ncbi:GNAT family N-acetyltransferase [Gemmatimonas groenlandica]|nr:GNAT family N-acetyltransferase [Gemmatimonas groenlandica]
MSPTGAPSGQSAQTREVTRTYLEMSAPQQLVLGHPPAVYATLDRIDPCSVETWRALYRQIGEPWHWHDRDAWDQGALAAHLARPEIQIYRVTAELGQDWTEAAGFLELERHTDGSVEIAYIGLDQRVLGRRLGGWLVAEAVKTAFAWGAVRVWLHTCTLDAPAALPNYLARGFLITGVETYQTTV